MQSAQQPWVASGVNPYDRLTWFLEVLPILIGVPILLAISACYEFIEWWAALLGGEIAEAFLGTQGDVWDTQWDMFLALLGSILAQLSLSRVHDRELKKITDALPQFMK